MRRTHRQKLLLQLGTFVASVFLGVILPSVMARAEDEIHCNKEQTLCVIDGSDHLVIGDRVGVVTPYDELVATGTVKKMKADRRAFAVDEAHGTIRRSHRVVLLTDRPDGESVNAQDLSIYREPKPYSFGAHIGYTAINAGNGSSGMSTHVLGLRRMVKNDLVEAQLGGVGSYMRSSGEVAELASQSTMIHPLTSTGIGAAPSAVVTIWPRERLSFHGMAWAGLMHISTLVGGEQRLVNDPTVKSNLTNGFTSYGSVGAGLVLNLQSWHVSANLSETFVHNAFGNTLGLGLSKDLY